MAAQLVKTEEDAAAPRQPDASPKAEDEVDFGGPEVGPPQRAMPDYGDLVDDDDVVLGTAKEAKKEEDGSKPARGPPRRDAIFVTGVQRLTRTHLAEIFEAKKLPVFRWVEWVEDDQVVCVFDNDQDAAKALRGCEAGFGDTGAEDRPGPGLWRAQRFMLDFRMATQADVPAAEFRRKHRGGQQVREFRFWEAIKDMDRNILGGADVEGVKHLPPSGEDAIAAADWDDDHMRRKRLRHGFRPGEDDGDDIDLLNRMAQQDKKILTKEEAGESASLPKVNDEPLVDVRFDGEDGERKDRADDWRDWGYGGGRGRKRGGADWGADDGRWWGGSKAAPGDENERKRRRGARGRPADNDGDGGGGGGARGGEGAADATDAPPAAGAPRAGFEFSVDDAEQARRSKRAERFKSA